MYKDEAVIRSCNVVVLVLDLLLDARYLKVRGSGPRPTSSARVAGVRDVADLPKGNLHYFPTFYTSISG